MRTFRVQARRRDGGWELRIEGVATVRVARLTRAEAAAREYVARTLDAAEDSFTVEVVACLDPETELMIQRAREASRRAEQAQREAARQARAVVDRLHREGLNGREIARCLGISPQRVSQLLAAAPARRPAEIR
ncbi:hypothetical protein NI17_011280 [Thermobifida halotolerans]|uniref:Uncharacterized protein n=1 Tax=Thermobifida halotolerans TaxID=483545 RepID=A0A399G6Q7_9ACTN|nr:hypothetical protein [Thermobifida halotolerans]UOE21623.1 hypothetical protein NI17_011280 [Thermobifida halotolerans]